MMRRIIILLLILTSGLGVAGCWDKLELNNLAIINGIAIESGSEGRYRVIVQTINPAAVAKTTGGGAIEFQKAYRNTVAEGDSLYEAFNNLNAITPARRFFSHVGVIIISEDLARDRGVSEILDYLERGPQVRLDPWVIIGRGNLTSLMDTPGRISLIPARRIKDIIELPSKTETFAVLRLGQFIRLLQSESSHPYTAGVESIANESIPNKDGHGVQNGQVPEPLKDIAINKTAVFRQDKFAGWLDKAEGCGLSWIRGDYEAGEISFEDPEEPGKKVGAAIINSKTKVKPELQNGEISITVEIEVESYLEDVQGKTNLEKTAVVARLEEAQGAKIKEKAEAALQKAQHEYKVDVFGFGEAVHRSYPKEWKTLKTEWSEIYPEVQVNIQVKSKIRHTSLISKPAEPASQK